MNLNFELSKKLYETCPFIRARHYWCKIDGKWETTWPFERTQNGYKIATEYIPAPYEDELLVRLKSITMSSSDYIEFKTDEWSFLIKKLIEKESSKK